MAQIVRSLIAALSLAVPLATSGQTVTVTTINDVVDFPAPQTIDELPGPDGRVSMREACNAVNNTPGPQTIAFAIPQSDWGATTTMAELIQDGGPYLLLDDGTVVDCTTQTAFTGDTNPSGNEVAIYSVQPNGWGSPAIVVGGDGCLIRGLDRVLQRGYGVEIRGNDNRVVGCTISGPLYAAVYISGGWQAPPASNNTVGGTAPGEGNRLSAGNAGVRIDAPAEDNVVIGNELDGTYYGAQVRSSPDYNMFTRRTRIGGPTEAERNIIAGAGRYGEEGFPVGSQVSVEDAEDTLIEGNYIGTTPDGTAAASPQRGPEGVRLRDAVRTTIRNNLISGIAVNGTNHHAGQRFGSGIEISGRTTATVIEGNLIGTDPSGQSAVPNHRGIVAVPFTANDIPTDARIGGVQPGEGNTIAFNEREGVVVSSLVRGVTIRGNSMFENGLLGIELHPATGGIGPTPNDPGDADGGANGLQNFPEIAAASTTSAGTRVLGTLPSVPNEVFALDFYSSAACDPSGHGEGAVFLGSATVTTDSSGQASFDAVLPVAAPAGSQITGTATRIGTGDTSEFSACVRAAGGVCAGDMDGSGDLTLNDFIMYRDLFTAGDMRADMDGDGTLALSDFVAFRNAYVAGC